MQQPSIPNPSQRSEAGADSGAPARHLRQELDERESLFHAQPRLIQRFLESQARQLAEGLIANQAQTRFTFPDQVVAERPKRGDGKLVAVPKESREQMVGGLVDRLTRQDIRIVVRQRLIELEQNGKAAVAASARLMRHATAMHMVHGMLPAGRSVTYAAAEGESIPSRPTSTGLEPESAITATTDAIAEESQAESNRGDLIVPYVPAARRFYLPQWVAFDEDDRLLIGSLAEAQAHVESMQRFLAILHAAVSLAPYMVADEEYQRKRYGMLGQLVNQGRALARFQTREIISIIEQRAAANDLNRGLSLSLPYFDDQDLEMRSRDFEVIPGGRIMFVPAFVVRAAEEEQVKVAQDTRLDPATRKHLAEELLLLESAFQAPARKRGADSHR
jgi:hypothetical protein